VARPLQDGTARDEALDTTRSILVQAPAGSGKTELLAKRMLKLLAEVEEPEEVLAITFTKSATGEMRDRILSKLEAAQRSAGKVEDALARAVLRNSELRGWRILEQPQRLNIQTIDSLCLRIAHRMPLLARVAGTLQPTENAQPLYRLAARRTFDRLGGADAELNDALRALLLLRDSHLGDCEALLQEMLATRDQWGHRFSLSGNVDWEAVRAEMEAPFQRAIDPVLTEAHALFSRHPMLVSELLELANYACDAPDLKIDILALAGLNQLPPTSSPQHWSCIANLLLKKEDDWLLNPSGRHGFPKGDGKNSHEARQKDRRIALGEGLRQIPGLLPLLIAIRGLPPPRYTEEEWQILRHMFTALRHAVRELERVFAEQRVVDFIEIGMSALRVLDGQVFESQGIRHLLVDEFQDTSRRQHQLLASLLRHWKHEGGRTLFLVGDPMQSIYLFRQADVELFEMVRTRGITIANTVRAVKSLSLSTNFRSNAGVVDPLNTMFAAVFPHKRRADAAGVDFLPGVAHNVDKPSTACQVHASFIQSQSKSKNGKQNGNSHGDNKAAVLQAEREETAEILKIVARHLPRIAMARRRGGDFTVAVLARAKNHLTAIAAALRDQEVSFRAIELEKLGDRQEVLDLQSLTRALLHPLDRIAWLALLRAPWCGLELRDLHLLCGDDDRPSSHTAVRRQIAERLHLIGKDSNRRVTRLVAVLDTAVRERYAQASFASWIERTWRSLGGPACVDAAGYENALAYFHMLERIAPDGIAATGETMKDQLDRLFALPDPTAQERCGVQLMTIHKAKGLGFNVVILPGLHRAARQDPPSLICYIEKSRGGGTEMIAAPIGAKGQDASSLYKWVRRQKYARAAEERKRLLYVACTRARDELHLFATATASKSGSLRAGPGTLLETAWPAVAETFQQRYEERLAPTARRSDNVISFAEPLTQRPPLQGMLDFVAAAKAPAILHRLPTVAEPVPRATDLAAGSDKALIEEPPRMRPEASRHSRTLGTTVHLLFERAAGLLEQGQTREDLVAGFPRYRRLASAFARNQGLTPPEVESCAKQAAEALESALSDPIGGWILKPRPAAQSEASWSGVIDGKAQTLRIDRSFRAGAEPLRDEGDFLWIVDYKTASHRGPDAEAFLDVERTKYKEQLEKYGEMSRLAFGVGVSLRFGLYYPLLKRFDWWHS
jgi:ATP-dependent exoDNAse (exonuclease V) beta subunit